MSMSRPVSFAIPILLAAGAACSERTPERNVASAEALPTPRDDVHASVTQAREPDVVFVPTPQERVDVMLELAAPQPGEKLYDLGCGDGRIPITAAREHGVQGVCVDIDPERIAEARAAVLEAGVEDLVEVRQADLFELDLSDADIVTLYLLPRLNVKLRPTLQRDLRDGARVVSHDFDMGDWTPDETRMVSGSPVYLWVIRKD